jgi:hypothetical protein
MDDDETSAYSPAKDLGNVFISGIGDVNVEDFCHECREELGILNLLGFKP